MTGPIVRPGPYSEAREEITACSGRQFDPEVVKIFLSTTEDEWVQLLA